MKYRIKIYNTAGNVILYRPFEDKSEWDSYWVELTEKQESLLVFAGQGMITIVKEYLTPAFNWEAETVLPVLISPEAIQ